MSNLLGLPPYQKTGESGRKKTNTPTTAQRERWERIRALGCILRLLGYGGCDGRITIQHCGTGMGTRKDHDKCISLCWNHHLGREGISYSGHGRKVWEQKYKPESYLLEMTKEFLGETSD